MKYLAYYVQVQCTCARTEPILTSLQAGCKIKVISKKFIATRRPLIAFLRTGITLKHHSSAVGRPAEVERYNHREGGTIDKIS